MIEINREERTCLLVATIGHMIAYPHLVATIDREGYIQAESRPRKIDRRKIILRHEDLCSIRPSLKRVDPNAYIGPDLADIAARIARALLVEKPGILDYPENA